MKRKLLEASAGAPRSRTPRAPHAPRREPASNVPPVQLEPALKQLVEVCARVAYRRIKQRAH